MLYNDLDLSLSWNLYTTSYFCAYRRGKSELRRPKGIQGPMCKDID